jgi:Multicopper oxidase
VQRRPLNELIDAINVVPTVFARSPATSVKNNQGTTVLPIPQVPTGPGVPTALNMGMVGAPLSLTSLQAPQTVPIVKHFMLTAEAARISLGSGVTINGWTFNGTAPGPTLHVQQGDLVMVTLINHLSFGVTIHWHDVAFVANNPGIWMLHCHNFLHANWGMDMMVAYKGISTPYTTGSMSGNFPD